MLPVLLVTYSEDDILPFLQWSLNVFGGRNVGIALQFLENSHLHFEHLLRLLRGFWVTGIAIPLLLHLYGQFENCTFPHPPYIVWHPPALRNVALNSLWKRTFSVIFSLRQSVDSGNIFLTIHTVNVLEFGKFSQHEERFFFIDGRKRAMFLGIESDNIPSLDWAASWPTWKCECSRTPLGSTQSTVQ